MAIEGEAVTVPLSAGQRVDGLNHLAQIRGQLLHCHCEKDLARFFADMRDKTDRHVATNMRVLTAILYLANIGRSRHDMAINQFTADEIRALIQAMNHLKAVVSLFPKRLTLPD